jgi:hypothetical protein
MSILANQNINNLNAPVAAAEGGESAKWVKNLGRNSSQDAEGIPGGWGGYKYSPPGLSESILGDKWRVGPQGKMLMGGVGEYEYGPKEYARLRSSDSAKGEYSSLLTSFAFMIAKGGEWAASDDDGEEEAKPPTAAARMKQTFTSGSQMRSLWNAETGINGTPTSSGGTFTGYQADHTYGISNWFMGDEVSGVLRRDATATELDDAQSGAATVYREHNPHAPDAESQKAGRRHRAHTEAQGFGGGTEETVTPLVNIDTGIRNIPGMMGPKS